MRLIEAAGELWTAATRSPFLEAAAAGTLPQEAFQRWLAQDYLFAKGLTCYQAIVVSKVPRECHQPVIAGLGALDAELGWFESHAGRLGLNLNVPPHPSCRRYIDFLMRAAYTQPYPVLLTVLYGVEVCYLAAWSAFPAVGPCAEFIARWSSPGFREYVAALERLAAGYEHAAAQEYFNQVLGQERDFWRMSWEG